MFKLFDIWKDLKMIVAILQTAVRLKILAGMVFDAVSGVAGDAVVGRCAAALPAMRCPARLVTRSQVQSPMSRDHA